MKKFICICCTVLYLSTILYGCNEPDKSTNTDINLTLSAWKDGLQNTELTDYFQNDINEVMSLTENNVIEISYLVYDFDNDNNNDYLITITSPLHSSTQGDYNCILTKKGDEFTKIDLPSMPIHTPQKDNLFGFSYFEVTDTETNGFPDLILYSDNIIYMQYDGKSYQQINDNIS